MDRAKQARTVDVDVKFINPDDKDKMLAGYSADVEIILELRKDTLRIPTEAILDGKRAFIYNPDRKIINEVIIEKGISNWAYTEVISGLNMGDQIVVNVDLAGVEDGVSVMMVNEE